MGNHRLIVITGVTRGLGSALTDEFIRRGHTVWGCGRSTDKIKALREQYGPPHNFAVVDVSDPAAVDVWAAERLATHQVPDLLINNAAIINQPAPLWLVPPADFDQLIDINIKGTANVIRAFFPAMEKKNAGVIVNFSSGWGRSTSPEVAPYCASKWAIEGLSKAMADEVPTGMAVVPLNPGIIDTDMLRICFGGGAGGYHKADRWAGNAAETILGITRSDNGKSLSVR